MASRAAHAATIAVLPLVDDRSPEAPDDAKGEYLYQGRRYRGTNLRWLKDPELHRLTGRMAESILASGAFARVVLVLEPGDAPEADLLLQARIRRARGYVEAEPESGAPWVLSEVVLSEVRILDARTRELRFHGDVGWTLFEQREGAVDPWVVLAETMDRAIATAAEVWRSSDFTSFVVEPKLDDDALEDSAVPRGWSRTEPRPRTAPRGWDGEERCEEHRYVQRQATRFHRSIGPYLPSVLFWLCPPDVVLRWKGDATLPAAFVGKTSDGRWLFAVSLGPSNWDDAVDEISRLSTSRLRSAGTLSSSTGTGP
ncbi:MAG: hypothetical protein HC923_05725 [Myxococcales bacterium]|nr:hypothetical protein [Myxococcales bacterium]